MGSRNWFVIHESQTLNSYSGATNFYDSFIILHCAMRNFQECYLREKIFTEIKFNGIGGNLI